MQRHGRRALIEVEVQTVTHARQALAACASWIMLDNIRLPQMRQVVTLRNHAPAGGTVFLEASGAITLSACDQSQRPALTPSQSARSPTALPRST